MSQTDTMTDSKIELMQQEIVRLRAQVAERERPVIRTTPESHAIMDLLNQIPTLSFIEAVKEPFARQCCAETMQSLLETAFLRGQRVQMKMDRTPLPGGEG